MGSFEGQGGAVIHKMPMHGCVSSCSMNGARFSSTVPVPACVNNTHVNCAGEPIPTAQNTWAMSRSEHLVV
jgi:hypothetical protein